MRIYENNIEKIINSVDFNKILNNLAKKYKNKKVVFYGTGRLFKEISKNYSLGEKFNIIGFSDIKFSGGDDFMGYKAFPPEKIVEEKPDAVIIFNLDYTKVANFFHNILFTEFGKFNYEPVIKPNLIDIFKSFCSCS